MTEEDVEGEMKIASVSTRLKDQNRMKSNIQTSEFKSKTFPPAYNPSKTPTFASPDYPVPSNLCNVPIMLNSRCSQLLNASSNSRNPDFIQGDKPPNMILCEILS